MNLPSPSKYGPDSEELQLQAENFLHGVEGTTPLDFKKDVQSFDQLLWSAIRSLREAEHWIPRWFDAELTEVRFRVEDDGVLVIVKAVNGERPVVAFLHSTSIAAAIISLGLALANASLNWKTDKYPRKPRY